MSIDALYTELVQARQTWMGIYNLLRNGQYDLAGPRSLLDSQPIKAFHRRVLIVMEGLFSIRPGDMQSTQAALFAAKINEVRSPLQSFQAHAQSTLTSLTQLWRDGAKIRDGNNNFSFNLFVDNSNIGNFDCAANFTQLHASLNQITTHLAILLPLCKATGVADLTERARMLGDLVRDAETFRGQAAQMATAAAESAGAASDRDKATQSVLAQAEAALAKLAALQQQATTDTASVTALVEKIKTIGSTADSLEEQITEYQGKFDAFQKQLDDRNARFAKFEKDTQVAADANAKRDEEVNRLTKWADAMICGATTAGLAKSLEDTRQRYETRMNSAKSGFKWSVLLLIVSALPLAAHLLPGLFGSWIPPIDLKAEGI